MESSLQRLKLPREQWDAADTVLTAQAAVTPLILEPTPVIALTPLLNRALVVLPKDDVLPANAALPLVSAKPWVPKASAPVDYPRRFTLSGFVLHAAVFFWVDRGYTRHDLVLSDMGYVCGLLSVLLGFLLAVQTVRILFMPKSSNMNGWSVLHGLLMCAAAFFSYTLALSLENAAVLALLAVQAWIGVRVIRIAGSKSIN